MTEVILVNEKDEPVGTMEKLQAHQEGRLHRAFSVFIINKNKQLLLQQRASHKYHSAGLWSNACCSHPTPNESIQEAAVRRVREELGICVSNLTNIFSFEYKAALENNLTEHELDHVLLAHYDGEPAINEEEVSDWKYFSLAEIKKMLHLQPEQFTVWFKLIMPRLEQYFSL